MTTTAATTESANTVESFLPLVRRTARSVARRLPRHVDVDDLIGAGVLGLINALARCEPADADHFVGYASIRIRGAILDHLREMDWLPRGVRAAHRRSADLSGAPLASILSVEALSTGGYERFARNDPTPSESVEAQQRRARVRRALAELPPRQRRILTASYYEEKTLTQIGVELGVSESRVCQLRSDALTTLRAALVDDVDLAR